MIRVNGLTKIFSSGLKAINQLDLEVRKGEILALLGPNGAGKTTTIRVLSTLSGFDDGEVFVAGHDVDREPEKVRCSIGVVAQQTGVDYFLTGRENLVLQGRMYRMSTADIERRVTELSEYFQIGDALDRTVMTYSGGMRRKLDIATALIHKPDVLFLDEPTLGLDILFRKRFFDQLLNDYFFGERTIIISTHQVEEVENILTHVVFMNHGKVIMNKALSEIEQDYIELHAVGECAAKARAIPHIGSRNILGGQAIIYEHTDQALLSPLGELRTPSVSNLFVAKVAGGTHHE